MSSRGIPSGRWRLPCYERRHFTFAETNHRVGSYTRDLFASWFPRVFTPIVRYSIYAILDDSMLKSFGFPKPLPFTRTLINNALKLRGRAIRFLPPRKEAHFFTDDRNRTYPQGYNIAALGPPKLVANETRPPTTTQVTIDIHN